MIHEMGCVYTGTRHWLFDEGIFSILSLITIQS